jgi:hypothetical protein
MESWNRFAVVRVLSMGAALLAGCTSSAGSRATVARLVPELNAFASHGRDNLAGRSEWTVGATASWHGPIRGPALTITDPAAVDAFSPAFSPGGQLPCEFDDLCALAALAAEEAVEQWERAR